MLAQACMREWCEFPELQEQKGNPVIYNNMDEPGENLAKQNMSCGERQINTVWYCLYIESLKEESHTHRDRDLDGVPCGWVGKIGRCGQSGRHFSYKRKSPEELM